LRTDTTLAPKGFETQRMGTYPEVQQALPQDSVFLTRTARLLNPWIILTNLCILGTSSALSLVIAGVGFAGQRLSSGLEFAMGALVVAVSSHCPLDYRQRCD